MAIRPRTSTSARSSVWVASSRTPSSTPIPVSASSGSMTLRNSLNSQSTRVTSRRAVRVRTTGALVGVISDTHGLVRPEARRALRGVDLIIHAGDVGGRAVLDVLGGIARVIAVRGNNDRDA